MRRLSVIPSLRPEAEGANLRIWPDHGSGRLGARPVDPVVDLGEEIVAALHRGEPLLVDPRGLDLLIELAEAKQVLAGTADGVIDHGAGLDDERPVAAVGEEQLAGGLVEGA